MIRRYTYRGDRITDPRFKGQLCTAVLDSRGKCIRGRNANMLVQFDDGTRAVILARQLRKIKQPG